MSNIQIYLNEIKKYEVLTPEKQLELFKKYRAGDDFAYNKLAECNLRYVVSVAKTYLKTGLNFEDLISAGNEGLVKAIQNYDPDKGYRFTTYAIWWIRQSILSAVPELNNIIRLPTNRQQDLLRTKKAVEKKSQELGRDLTHLEISNLSDYNDYYPNHITKLLSLNDITENEEEYINLLHDDSFDNMNLEKEDLEVFINDLLKDCTFKEKDIITLYLGLGGIKPMTLDQIGKMYNLSRERVRQLKELTLSRLKKHKNFDE